MSYQKAMEFAGAKVLIFKEFGSYQGEWWAKVEYKGKAGWVNGSYGSCSGCDAFQGEFDTDDSTHEHGEYTYYNPMEHGFKDGCEKCEDFKNRLLAFGENYLDNILTQNEAEKKASENLDWDDEAEEMVQFIKDNK